MGWLSLFVEPLVIIGISLLVLIILNKREVKLKILLRTQYILVGFYIVVATPLGANYLLLSIEVTGVDLQCKNATINTVVILGGGITGTAISEQEIWRLKEASYRRTLVGLELAKTIAQSTIIVSGGHGGSFKEADLMGNLLQQSGFSGHIIKDNESLNTYKSSVNVTKLLMNNGIVKYWLVTSSLHMRRAESVFMKQGLQPCLYPVNSKYVNTQLPESLLPQISALDKSTAVFHELLGYFWYVLSGKI